MKKVKEYLPTFLLVVGLLICLVYFYLKENNYEKVIVLDDVEIVPTLISNVENNTIWCGTFQLIWNDLQEEVGSDIVFLDDMENQMVLDLNQRTFTENDISGNYYYKNYGFMTPSLKEEIEKGISEKFQETSNILNNFEFQEDSKDYFFYTMLVVDFEFLKPFDNINNNIFGITNDSLEELNQNVKVLYYLDDENYAVLLKTTTDTEVILVKGENGNNFLEMYQSLNLENQEDFLSDDIISISKFNFEVEGSFDEIEEKEFLINDESYTIGKTMQTIEFKMDNKGGSLKSEAGMEVNKGSISNRVFDFTDDFTLFLKEEDKSLPYFAINIDNIEDFR